MILYEIVDENGNEADECAYANIVDAGMAADGYAKETGKSFVVKELCRVDD